MPPVPNGSRGIAGVLQTLWGARSRAKKGGGNCLDRKINCSGMRAVPNIEMVCHFGTAQ
jgi:hypothetical protein